MEKLQLSKHLTKVDELFSTVCKSDFAPNAVSMQEITVLTSIPFDTLLAIAPLPPIASKHLNYIGNLEGPAQLAAFLSESYGKGLTPADKIFTCCVIFLYKIYTDNSVADANILRSSIFTIVGMITDKAAPNLLDI